MSDLPVAAANIVLDLQFNLKQLTVGPPSAFLAKTLSCLDSFHQGRKTFQVSDLSELLGFLQHIANTSCWLKYILSHLYTSLASCLRLNQAYLIHSSRAFKTALQLASSPSASSEQRSFAQSTTARQLHSSTTKYFFNTTAKLLLINQALRDDSIPKHSPIAYLSDGLSSSSKQIPKRTNSSVSMLWSNTIADEISRIKCETDSLTSFFLSYPQISTARWLSTLSPKCRSALRDFNRIIDSEDGRSNPSKSAVTRKSRQLHYMRFCANLSLDKQQDWCLASAFVEARHFVLACFTIHLIQGNTTLGGTIRHATLDGYVKAVVAMHTSRNLPSPLHVDKDLVGLLLKTIKRYERVPNRREMICDGMLAHLLHLATQQHETLDRAIIDWLILAIPSPSPSPSSPPVFPFSTPPVVAVPTSPPPLLT